MKKAFFSHLLFFLPLIGLADFIDLSEHLNRVDLMVMGPNGHIIAFDSGDSRIYIFKGDQLEGSFSTDRLFTPPTNENQKNIKTLPKGYTVAPDVDQTAVKTNRRRLVLAAGPKAVYAAWYNDTVIYVLNYTGKIATKMSTKFPIRALILSDENLYIFNGGYSPADNKFCEIRNTVVTKNRFVKISPTKIIKPFPTKIMDFKKKVYVTANLSGGTTVYNGHIFFAPAMTQYASMFRGKKILNDWAFPFKYVNFFDYSKTDYAPDISINRTWTNWTSRSIQYGAKNYVTQILASEKVLYGVYQINDTEGHYGNLLFCYDHKAKKLVWHKEFDESQIFLLKADPKTVVFYNSQLKRVEILQH